MKQLFIYSNQESNISKIALMHSIDIQTQKYTIYTYAKLNKLDLASIVTGEFVGIFLNYLFPTNFKALQEQYESIVYQLYTFKDDSPLAVIRDHFVTYPFAINSKFISFDLKKIFYGIDLCTGVFDTHFSFHYEIDQKLEENKEFLLKRLLSYLIIDEKRNATALEDIKEQKYIIDDYTFYFKELKSLELKNALYINFLVIILCLKSLEIKKSKLVLLKRMKIVLFMLTMKLYKFYKILLMDFTIQVKIKQEDI